MAKMAKTFTSHYGPIERAAMAAYSVPAKHLIRFRGWTDNLRKLGILGKKGRIGRGAPLTYTPTELHRLLCGLELTEAGIPPLTTVALIEALWPKLWPIFMEATRPLPYPPEQQPGPGEDIFLFLDGLALRTGAWSAPKSAKFPGVRKIDSCRRRELMEKLAQVTARVIVINLTERLKRFHDAFRAEYLKDAIEEARVRANASAKSSTSESAAARNLPRSGGRIHRGLSPKV